MASITKRTTNEGKPYYTVRVRLKGYPVQTATFDRLTDAREWAKRTETAIKEGRHFKTAEAKKHTFADLVNRYIKDVVPRYNERERKERAAKMQWWAEQIGPYMLADVNPALLVECRDTLSQSRSPATVVRYMAALSHAFTIAVNEWQWMQENPAQKVKKPKEPRGRVRFLNDGERQRLLDACKESKNEYLYLAVILAIGTGMRQGELMGLKWKDVDLKAGALILHETKNGDRRRVPLAGHGLELLREHAKVRRIDTDLLFPAKHGDRPINLRSAFEYALERAGIDNFHWHDLRHCTASYLAMNGASLAEIAEILGHKTLAMVKRYAHLSDGHVSNVVASMNAKIFGGV
ncbi:tyrosine-type recombinase/integrase [Methylosarcina fibrata]|uniref:tyrosine-type recombinase/integrase n=1 Tax=Methylosarcina fibrata TaxID=105972 RepID=UPI00036D70BF|nr:site-specific integrase [Methylosarcina fibrata]